MPIKIDRINKITSNIGKASILILGDIMLDEYLHGVVSRISPEAPVPVVEINHEQLRLGGSANVASNGLCATTPPTPPAPTIKTLLICPPVPVRAFPAARTQRCDFDVHGLQVKSRDFPETLCLPLLPREGRA